MAHHDARSEADRRPDLVEGDFTASQPGELVVADFTYVRCWEGLVFFAFCLDVFSRMILGWQLAGHMRAERARHRRAADGARHPQAPSYLPRKNG